MRGTNRFLPRDIAVQWCRPVGADFHARYSARGRRYRFIVLQSPVRPSLEQGLVGWVFRVLDGDAMRAAAAHADRRARLQLVPIGRVPGAHAGQDSCMRLHIERRGAYWRFDFDGSAFLHHMVRNIMGCLVAVGSGREPPAWMGQVLAARSRDAAAPTFAPDGLYFVGPVLRCAPMASPKRPWTAAGRRLAALNDQAHPHQDLRPDPRSRRR